MSVEHKNECGVDVLISVEHRNEEDHTTRLSRNCADECGAQERGGPHDSSEIFSGAQERGGPHDSSEMFSLSLSLTEQMQNSLVH